jgi:hypothetical protein
MPTALVPTVVCNFITNRNQNGHEKNTNRCNFKEYVGLGLGIFYRYFTIASTLAISRVLPWNNRGYTTPSRGITEVIPRNR